MGEEEQNTNPWVYALSLYAPPCRDGKLSLPWNSSAQFDEGSPHAVGGQMRTRQINKVAKPAKPTAFCLDLWTIQ